MTKDLTKKALQMFKKSHKNCKVKKFSSFPDEVIVLCTCPAVYRVNLAAVQTSLGN